MPTTPPSPELAHDAAPKLPPGWTPELLQRFQEDTAVLRQIAKQFLGVAFIGEFNLKTVAGRRVVRALGAHLDLAAYDEDMALGGILPVEDFELKTFAALIGNQDDASGDGVNGEAHGGLGFLVVGQTSAWLVEAPTLLVAKLAVMARGFRVVACRGVRVPKEEG